MLLSWLMSVALAASPALVTTTTGELQLAGAAAPAAPFVWSEADALHLAPGATAVVLYQGRATTLTGPLDAGRGTLDAMIQAPPATAAALDGLLSRQATEHRVAASRGASPLLLRPVPDSRARALRDVRVGCQACDELAVTVHDLSRGEDVWTTTVQVAGDKVHVGAAPYDGPRLAPGPYLLRVGDTDFAVEIVDGAELAGVDEALAWATDGMRPGDAASVPAAAFWKAGLVTDSLYALDAASAAHPGDPQIASLRASYEARAGVLGPH